MRVYNIAVAALALDVDRKWLDNLVAQHHIAGVERFTRGVSRRLSVRALLAAAIVRDLQRELGVPAGRAVEAASRALASSHHHIQLSPAVSVHLDLSALERALDQRLVHAMETAVPRRRGRPPGQPRKAQRGTR